MMKMVSIVWTGEDNIAGGNFHPKNPSSIMFNPFQSLKESFTSSNQQTNKKMQFEERMFPNSLYFIHYYTSSIGALVQHSFLVM